MITVKCERARKLIFAHMSGFLSFEEVARFSREEQALIEAAHIQDEFYLLVDTSEAVIQTQEITLAFQRLMTDSKYKARRIALVRRTPLSRLQATRAIRVREGAEVFDSLEEAEAWLFAPDDEAPGASRAAA